MGIISALTAFFSLAARSKWVVWPLVSSLVGLIVLSVEREVLFNENLFGMERNYAPVSCPPGTLAARTADGTCNDMAFPAAGAVGTRFGRNIDPDTLPPFVSDAEVLDPNPRDVSLELMTRKKFIPAESLNLIAAAWIQFMVHDWFDHGENEAKNPIEISIGTRDPDFKKGLLEIRRTKRDTTYDPGLDQVVTYRNEVTQWWDGSQLYGSDLETQRSLREFKGGRLILDDGQLPHTWRDAPKTGFSRNWWVGLDLMHTVFVREHNRIAAMLSVAHPEMGDQQLFDTARLANTALIAKIHTLEWTTALLDHPTLIAGMNANWHGLGQGEVAGLLAQVAPYAGAIGAMFGTNALLDLQKMGAKAINGIVGNELDNYGVPFALTEEFVSVYRMHQLMPDTFSMKSLDNGKALKELSLDDVREGKARKVVKKFGLDNIAYSFGVAHPGALSLFNYPEEMQHIDVPLMGVIDLAAVDLVRDRERGVPRYNAFRAAIRLDPIGEFEDLFKRFDTDTLTAEQQATADKLRKVYGDVDRMDLMVGMMAEAVRPSGYAFGETAFQIFTLMASRRFLSDRFYTTDFRPEVYTQEGYDWVQTRSFRDVLTDNVPTLARAGMIPDNAFKPWTATVPSNEHGHGTH